MTQKCYFKNESQFSIFFINSYLGILSLVDSALRELMNACAVENQIEFHMEWNECGIKKINGMEVEKLCECGME